MPISTLAPAMQIVRVQRAIGSFSARGTVFGGREG